MEFIRFKNDDGIYAVNLTMVSEHILSMEFEKKIPENYLAGFYQLNKNNKKVHMRTLPLFIVLIRTSLLLLKFLTMEPSM